MHIARYKDWATVQAGHVCRREKLIPCRVQTKPNLPSLKAKKNVALKIVSLKLAWNKTGQKIQEY